MGCDMLDPAVGSESEDAVVDGEPECAERLDVVPFFERLLRLDDGAGRDVAGGHHSVIRLSAVEGRDGVPGVLLGDEGAR